MRNGNDIPLGNAPTPQSKQQNFRSTKPVHQLASSEYCLDTAPEEPESEFYDDLEYDPLYVLEHHSSTHKTTAKPTIKKKYQTCIMVSSNGNDFSETQFQIDTGALCNTLSNSAIWALDPQPVVNPSPHVLLPYGDSPPIKPIGETELLCMHGNQSVAL